MICLGLGFALLVMAPLFRFYVTPSVAQTPIDFYTQSTGVGVVIKQLDLTKFAAGDPNPYYPENLPMTNTGVVRGDVAAAQQDPAKSENLAVFDVFSRTNTEDGRLVNASTGRYAFGRQNSQLNNCCGANVGNNNVNFTGIFNLKFPFFLEQTTYQVWDDTLLTAVPANFSAEEDHYGINTYKFQINVPATMVPNSTQNVPAKAVGQAGSGTVAVNPYYSVSKTIWVEPLTGQIVDSKQSLLTTFRGPDGTTDLVTFIQLEAGGQPSYVENAIPGIKSKATLLNLIMNVLPIVFVVLGIVLIVIGVLLVRSLNREFKEREVAQSPPALV